MQAAVTTDLKIYEVKVFDRAGKLKKVISKKALAVRADKKFKEQMFPGKPRPKNRKPKSSW